MSRIKYQLVVVDPLQENGSSQWNSCREEGYQSAYVEETVLIERQQADTIRLSKIRIYYEVPMIFFCLLV